MSRRTPSSRTASRRRRQRAGRQLIRWILGWVLNPLLPSLPQSLVDWTDSCGNTAAAMGGNMWACGAPGFQAVSQMLGWALRQREQKGRGRLWGGCRAPE